MAEKQILVADDETHILHVVSLKLRNAGYGVSTARDGLEALEIAMQRPIDLLITDYHMPHLSGLELCRKLKENPATAGIPAIMLTARGYHLEPRDTAESGILKMLSKPFSPRHLLATVDALLADEAAASAGFATASPEPASAADPPTHGRAPVAMTIEPESVTGV